MTVTNDQTSGVTKDELIILLAQKRLLRLYSSLGTWRAVESARGVNHAYIISLVAHGKVPTNKMVRRALFLPAVMPSERRARVARVLPPLGSPDWERVFFKRPRVRKWKHDQG